MHIRVTMELPRWPQNTPNGEREVAAKVYSMKLEKLEDLPSRFPALQRVVLDQYPSEYVYLEDMDCPVSSLREFAENSGMTFYSSHPKKDEVYVFLQLLKPPPEDLGFAIEELDPNGDLFRKLFYRKVVYVKDFGTWKYASEEGRDEEGTPHLARTLLHDGTEWLHAVFWMPTRLSFRKTRTVFFKAYDLLHADHADHGMRDIRVEYMLASSYVVREVTSMIRDPDDLTIPGEWASMAQQVCRSGASIYAVVSQDDDVWENDDLGEALDAMSRDMKADMTMRFGPPVELDSWAGLFKIPPDSDWRALAEWALRNQTGGFLFRPGFCRVFETEAKRLLNECVANMPQEWARSAFQLALDYAYMRALPWIFWTLSRGHSVVIEVGPGGESLDRTTRAWSVAPPQNRKP